MDAYFSLTVSVQAPRPSVKLIGKSVQPSPSSSESNIQLADQNELPQDARLIFSVRAQSPSAFAHDETIEVATADESFSTTLSLGNGGITLQNAAVAVATLDPGKAFGSSAAGSAAVPGGAGGVAGDWQPLATWCAYRCCGPQVPGRRPSWPASSRVPTCIWSTPSPSDPQFDHPVQVPDGFPGYALPVPHPSSGQLYVKLRDDPSVVNTAALDAQQLPASADEAARASTRHAAAHADESSAAGAGSDLPAATAPASVTAPASAPAPAPSPPPAPSTPPI
jgi:hypothetical protein